MYNAVLLSAALLTGQVEAPPETVQVLPPISASSETVISTADVVLTSGTGCVSGSCGSSCSSTSCGRSCGGCSTGCGGCCHVEWLKPWTCDALKMEPVKN